MDIKFVSRERRARRVCVVVGTRPEIIKMAPVVKELSRRGVPFFILHAGQHYSFNMDRQFFEDLELPAPLHHLEEVRRHTTHASQTAEMMRGIEDVLFKERPSVVLVCGDANACFSGAVAARKLGLVVGHIEAGLRSHDWRMSEEHNRVMIDHISELLFAPTERARQNLLKEGVNGEISVTGNTVVDASLEHVEIARGKSRILESTGLEPGYILLTMHREENVDDYLNLRSVLEAMRRISRRFADLPIIFPAHPRTVKRIGQFGLGDELKRPGTLRLLAPVGYLDFLMLLVNAGAVLTDSGGIQEEACVLRVPCVTMRENTERPESIEVGGNILAGTSPEGILVALGQMLGKKRDWANPFGDGKTAERIVRAVDCVLKESGGIPCRRRMDKAMEARI